MKFESVSRLMKVSALTAATVLTIAAPNLGQADMHAPRQFKGQRSIASEGAAVPSLDPEIKLLKSFYTDYLNQNLSKPTTAAMQKRGSALFSKVFKSLESLNRSLCDRKAPGEICGWAADGDPFLAAQDHGNGLNAKTSKLSVAEMASTIQNHKIVVVKFTIDPSDNSPRSQREQRFVVGLEKGKWVVDDLITMDFDNTGKATEYPAVASMRSEINALFEMP